MTRRIIQFGTSRFLQAHVDLFVHEARCSGEDIGPITVVKTTLRGGSRRAHFRLQARTSVSSPHPGDRGE